MKKVLLYIVGIVLLLIAAFFSLGFIFPAVVYTTTIEINKPRDITWKIMRERKDWIYGFKSNEQLSGQPGEIGNRARVTVVREGNEMHFDTELLDIKPPEMSVTRLNNDMLTHEATVRLIENGGKTAITSDEKITGSNPFFRSLFVLVRGRITETSQKNFEGLKQVVETSN